MPKSKFSLSQSDTGLPDDEGPNLHPQQRPGNRKVPTNCCRAPSPIAAMANSLGMPRRQMEFLIDRFGLYRCPPDFGMTNRKAGNPCNVVRQQAERLNREPRIKPPPDDHLH